MAETDPKAGGTPSDGQQKTETTPETPALTVAELNRAFSEREKRLTAKLDEKIAKFESIAEKLTAKPQDTTPEAPEKDSKALKEVQALKAELAKERQAARTERTQGAIRKQLAGKVSEDWLDEATASIQGRVTYDKDGVASVSIGDIPYSLSEAADKWLSAPENKKFLPAPEAMRRAATPMQSAPTVPLTDGQGRKLSVDERLNMFVQAQRNKK